MEKRENMTYSVIFFPFFKIYLFPFGSGSGLFPNGGKGANNGRIVVIIAAGRDEICTVKLYYNGNEN